MIAEAEERKSCLYDTISSLQRCTVSDIEEAVIGEVVRLSIFSLPTSQRNGPLLTPDGSILAQNVDAGARNSSGCLTRITPAFPCYSLRRSECGDPGACVA
jgi:hypothetical protein